MIDKITDFLKECSDEKSKRGKSIKEFSNTMIKLGVFFFSYSFTNILWSSYLGISEDVVYKMYWIGGCGVSIFYLGFFLPWFFHQKHNIIDALNGNSKSLTIKEEVKEEIKQNNKGE